MQTMEKNKQPVHYCMIIGCLCVAYVMLYSWALDTGFIKRFPVLYNSDVSAFFLSIPAVYLSSITIFHEGKRPVRSYSVYFIPPAIFAIAFVIYKGLILWNIQEPLPVPQSHFSSSPITYMLILLDSLFVLAFLLNLFTALRLYKKGKINNIASFRYHLVFHGIYIFLSLFLLSAGILRNHLFLQISIFAFFLVMLSFALTHTTVYYFLPGQIPYLRQPILRPDWDSGSDELMEKMECLMNQVTPYRRTNLTLKTLANLLNVEPKRLSYHFHTHMKTNFSSYVNEWRLRSVCDDLIKKTDHSILDIALDNGFNSKSSFNTLFFKAYGMTPREFRKGKLMSVLKNTITF